MNNIKKKSSVKVEVAVAIMLISLLLVGISAKVNAKTRVEDTKVNSLIELKNYAEMLLNKSEEDLTQEEITKLQSLLDTAIEETKPVVGATINDMEIWLELMEANNKIEKFGRFMDMVKLGEYNPMNQEELKVVGVE